MKHYRKPLLAQDSERLIVMDDKVKHTTLEKVFLKVVFILSLMTLTVFGMSHLAVMQAFYDWIDTYFSSLDNQKTVIYYITALAFVIGFKLTVDHFKRK